MSKDAFISWTDSVLATTQGTRAELQLKVAAMYHRSVYFPVETTIVETVCEQISRDAGVNIDVTRNLFKSVYEIDGLASPEKILLICCSPASNTTWDKKGNIKTGLRGPVYRSLAQNRGISVSKLRKNMKEPGATGYAWRRATAYQAVASTGASNAWQQINQQLPCDLICFDEATAYAAMPKFRREILMADRTPLESIEVSIPSVSNLSWGNVFELREHHAVEAFRNWYNELGSTESRGGITEGLWEAFSEVIPNVKGTIVKGIASNVPLPIPINPLSVGLAIKDVSDAHQFQKKHSVTIFFHELRRLTVE